MYARGQSQKKDYRIPPGYHGNAFTEEVKVHTPQIYTRRAPVSAQRREGMTVYSPRDTVEDVPFREADESGTENAAARDDEGETYEDTAAYAERNRAESYEEDAEPDREPVDVPSYEGRTPVMAHNERDHVIGEVFRTLFANLRREDWLLVALLVLFLLDGSASADILILLAVLLAYRV